MWTTLLRLLGALFAVSLFAAACGTSTATDTASTAGNTEMEDIGASDEHGDDHTDGHDAHSSVLEVDPNLPIPDVSIELIETDTPGLFDLTVTLTNFTITPDNVDGDPIDNEGHMHLLIDGEKVERFYDLERQVTVPDGEHLVEVEVNANNHSAYAVDGAPIRDGATVTGAGEAKSDGHSHDHSNAAGAVEDGLTMEDADITVAATYDEGEVSLDTADRIEAAVGDVVMIMVTSDVAEQAHLHGYDILAAVEPGDAAMMLFTADTPGKFEIEFEESGTFIAELVVS